MENPKTYKGLDAEGNVKAQCTAVDANTLINPAEVQAAIDNVKSVFEEQLNNVASSLRDISQDADEAIIVQGTSMEGTIEDTATLLTQVSGQVTQGIDALYDYAVQAHDQLQIIENNKAYNNCIVADVVSVV
ncbi:MAG: hypothetical protein J6X28_06100 [Bacilli bacterium]|nr:hypothetical protein [Bacilli bacterium]